MDLTTPSVIKALLSRHEARPRHHLGQNFLIDQRALAKIVDTLAPEPTDMVLEIGPGLGVLTAALAPRARQVVAVELDRQMIAILHETLAGNPNVEVVQGDALKLDLAGLLHPRLSPGEQALVAANLPYYITTPLLLRLLEEPLPLRRLVVMVQLEVAERIVAKPGGKQYGALSIAVQYRTAARLAGRVRRSSFWPEPGVDSAIVAMDLHHVPPVPAPPAVFFPVVRAAFSQRRKTLANAISARLQLDKEVVQAACGRVGVDPGRRAETLSLSEFSALAMALAQADDTVGANS